ncbi:MAG: hypothetical protein ABH954_04915 [Candidatus Omnitrophota bacterium]
MKKVLFLIIAFILILNLNIFAEGLQFSFKGQETDSTQLVYTADQYRDPLKSWLPDKEIEVGPVGPARPLRTEGPDGPRFIIQGMVWDTDLPQAIIDGVVYKVGDQFQDAKILEISKDGVKLLYRDRIFIARPQVPANTGKTRR